MNKILTTISILFATCGSLLAQDRMASIAPIDIKMRTIDSIALVRLGEQESLADLQFPAAALYPTWNNDYTRSYGVQLPAEYKIDLRRFHMPCDSRMVTSHYGYRRSFRRQHYGTDIKVFIGDTIRAAFSGKVRVVSYERRGYGNYVVIRHPNGLETVYGHMSKNLVKPDQIVKAGEAIGLGGNTGRSTGYHLHLEFRYLGNPINPNDIVNFETHEIHKPVLVLNAQTFAYKAEIDKIRYWTVKKGDTLGRIAYRTGVSVNKLCSLNGITKNTVLRIGRKIRYT